MIDKMTDYLKPCPICGSVNIQYDSKRSHGDIEMRVVCNGCLFHGGTVTTNGSAAYINFVGEIERCENILAKEWNDFTREQ